MKPSNRCACPGLPPLQISEARAHRGIPSPGHSDCPVCTSNLWVGIYGLVTRKTSGGAQLSPKEAITPMEAIRAYTIAGAYSAWEEGIKGSVEEGKLVDIVVVDRDPLTIDSDDLKNVRTLLTVVDGKILHNVIK